MEWLISILVFILGIVIRFGIPILITVLLVWFFRRLDQRWQAEAQAQVQATAKNPGCWDINKCPGEKKATCRAYANPEKPCWQVFREPSGRLQERCVGCDVFRKAPVPIPA